MADDYVGWDQLHDSVADRIRELERDVDYVKKRIDWLTNVVTSWMYADGNESWCECGRLRDMHSGCRCQRDKLTITTEKADDPEERLCDCGQPLEYVAGQWRCPAEEGRFYGGVGGA